MTNTLKTVFLLLCFPLLLMATFWGILMTLVLIACGVLLMGNWSVTFAWPPHVTDIVPQYFWQAMEIVPPLSGRMLHTLPASPGMLWNHYAPLMMQTTLDAAPWLLVLSLLWLVIGFRYQDKLITAMSHARGIAHTECPPLYDALEDVCKRARMPMPKLYLARELPPNAFASGIGPSTYSITVTAGLIGQLDTAETRAVLAHELSHIRHGDVRLLIVALVIVGIFSWTAGVLWRYVVHSLMGYPTRYNRLLFSLPFVMLLATTLSVGAALSELLKRIILREREMQADAGAVTITGDASAMASALVQISGNRVQWQVPRTLRDMLIYAPHATWWRRLWSTHPSLPKRLAALQALGATPRVRGPALVRVIVKEPK
ncbi:MAG: M48 family metalloprotease [Bdellovibrionales bacterium]